MSALVTPEYIADFAVTGTANNTTLNGSYTAASGSMTVTSAAALSTTNQFHFYIADQTTLAVKCIGKATAVSSNTFTVTMSLDANANSGDLVYISLCAGAFRQLQADATSYGTFANLPTTVPPAGASYKQTDGPYLWISNGSVWQAFWNGYPVTTPPTTGWSSEGIASESGSAAGTVHYTNGFGYLIGNDLGNESIGTQYRAAPGSTPYSFTARMSVDFSGILASISYGLAAEFATQAGLVIGFRDSGGKYLVLSLLAESGNAYLVVGYLTSDTTYSSDVFALGDAVRVGALLYNHRNLAFRIRNDGTNLSFSISLDGQTFYVIYSETITSHLANAANVCWGAHKDGHSGTVCLYDWTQGT